MLYYEDAFKLSKEFSLIKSHQKNIAFMGKKKKLANILWLDICHQTQSQHRTYIIQFVKFNL